MATIIQKPDELSLLGNMRPFIASSASEITFKLLKDDDLILEEMYYPDQEGRVEIDLRDVISEYLSIELPSSNVYVQSGGVAQFSVYIDSEPVGTFTVVKAGVRKLPGLAKDFLKANWLTWQPQSKSVKWSSPEYLSYYFIEGGTVKAKFYLTAGGSETVPISAADAGNLVSFNVAMSYLFEFSSHEKSELYGIVDVWAEDMNGTRMSYIQRYIYSPEQGNEHVYVCANSLGGIDTFTFRGSCTLSPEIEHQAAERSDRKIDITNSVERKWQQNTGYLTPQYIKWFFEFVSSGRQWAVIDGRTEAIVLDTSSLQLNDSENLQSCTFQFALAEEGRLLNLSRVETELPLIEVASPSGEIFFLAPRLIDYPDADLDDSILFLVQSPYSQTWSKTSLGTLRQWITGIFQDAPVRNQFLSRLIDDVAKGNITFEQMIAVLGKAIFKNGAEFGDFISSLYSGTGAGIDKNGNGEFQSIRVRGYFEAMEYIVNRLSAIEGDQLLTEADTIESIDDLGNNCYGLHLRSKWDGYFTAQASNNVLKGIINTLGTGAGTYYTSWMRVNSVNRANNYIEVSLYPGEETPAGTNYPPCEMMKIARWGNQTDTKRQSCIYLSSTEGRIVRLTGVTKPIIDTANYGATFGTLPEFLLAMDLPIIEGQDYVYARGLIVQDIIRIDYQGQPVCEIIDRGQWSADADYYCKALNPTTGQYEISDVWYMGCKYRCAKTGTKTAPAWNNTDWAMIEGNPEFTVEFAETDYLFDPDRFALTLTIIAKLYNIDITDDILDADVQWTRYSEDADGNERVASDTAWALKRANEGKSIDLTVADCDFNGYIPKTLKFIATVTLRDGMGNEAGTESAVFEY